MRNNPQKAYRFYYNSKKQVIKSRLHCNRDFVLQYNSKILSVGHIAYQRYIS